MKKCKALKTVELPPGTVCGMGNEAASARAFRIVQGDVEGEYLTIGNIEFKYGEEFSVSDDTATVLEKKRSVELLENGSKPKRKVVRKKTAKSSDPAEEIQTPAEE